MIKASELRIGIHVLHNDALVEVKGFIKNDDSLGTIIVYIDSEPIPNYSKKPVSPKDIDPIPLTPEWLERCGLELRKEDKIWQIQVGNTSYLEIEAEEPFMCGVTPETWRDICPIYIWNEIKHVHQLQNIYFALTGEELTIKQ